MMLLVRLLGQALGYLWFGAIFGGVIVYAAVSIGFPWGLIAVVFPLLVFLGSLRYR
jgi:hypothetical protein